MNNSVFEKGNTAVNDSACNKDIKTKNVTN